MNMEKPLEFDDVEILEIDESEKEEDVQEIGSEKRKEIIHGSGIGTSASKKPKVTQSQSRGPIDTYFFPKPTVMGKRARQTTIDESSPIKKELRERVCVAIAQWMYDVGIASSRRIVCMENNTR